MFNSMAKRILGHMQLLPILSGSRSSITQCSSDNPSLLAQNKVVANQLQVKYSKWVTYNPGLAFKWLTTSFTYTFCRLVARLVQVTSLAVVTQLVRQVQTRLQTPNCTIHTLLQCELRGNLSKPGCTGGFIPRSKIQLVTLRSAR